MVNARQRRVIVHHRFGDSRPTRMFLPFIRCGHAQTVRIRRHRAAVA